MKKIVCMLAATALIAGAMAGCSTGEVGTSTPAGNSSAGETGTTAKLTGKLVMNGSTSMEKVCGALNEAFKEKNPDLTIDLQLTGSGAAITSLDQGTAQIGNLSRAVKESENAEGKYEVITIALDGIAVIVHPDNAVTDLSKEQLASIFTKEKTNWKDFGGADESITVIGRETGSGTRDGFEDVVGVKDECQYDATVDATGTVVARVASDSKAIGYVSLASVSKEVKAVSVGGVTPSESTVADKSYTLQRPFVHAYKKDTKDPNVLAYLEYLKTDEAQKIIADEGLVAQKFW